MTDAVTIRAAAPADLPGILAIYNHAIVTSTASYHLQPTTLEERERWLAEHGAIGLPVLVAHDAAGTVVGWASLSSMRTLAAYRYTAENTVYVLETRRACGIGTALLDALVAEGRAIGLHAIVAWIDSHSAASVRMHRRAGFVDVGFLPQVGAKFGAWLDVVLMQLMLDEAAPPSDE